jgi:plastocyanin
MPLRSLVVIALAICAFAGVITAVADKGRDQPPAGSASTTGSPAKRPVSGTQPKFQGATVHVVMRNLAFAPHTIRLRVGDRVVFRNADNVGHNVTTQENASGTNLVDLNSPTIAAGRSYTYVARYAGETVYVCTIHPTTMQARIVVAKRS